MNGEGQLQDDPIRQRELPPEVQALRTAQEADNAANEEIVKSRIAAQAAASRIALDEIEKWHRQLAEQTDLQLNADSRASAIWLVAGRCLGLAEAMWVQVNAGITSEVLVTGRSIHEATRLLPIFRNPEEEELVRLWLADGGRSQYVKPNDARAAQARFEEVLAEAMTREGFEPLESAIEKTESMYDRLSRVAHNRRSACLDSVWEPGREVTYGRHPSALRRGDAVQWAGLMTVEVLLAVGDALGAFFGPSFFKETVKPLIAGIEAVQETAPLGEDKVRQAADTG